MGTIFWKPVVQAPFSEFLEWARGEGLQLIGTSAHAEADYRMFVPRSPWCLILGSEQKGLSAEQLSVCETSLALPMRGRASSLNLAVAAGILLYSLAK
jgi:TrmH family RNA methyltransferase